MLGIIKNGCYLKIKNFEGPLDLLLELIQNAKMDITEVSLSSITDQYLTFIHSAQIFQVDLASEFILIASILIYYKTKKLLPGLNDNNEDELIDEQTLIERLKEYKKFKKLAYLLWQKKEEGEIYFERKISGDIIFKSKNIAFEKLMVGDLIKILYRYKGAFIRKPIPIKRKEVSVEEKMNLIMKLLSNRSTIKFSEIAYNEKTKIDKVASFLGSLELSFRQRILLKQLKLFADIELHKKDYLDY